MNRCIIIGGGDCEKTLFYDYNESSDFVIAADGGYKYCINYGIVPNLIIGDFDSYLGTLPENIETIKLPVKKDDTDLIFAVKCGIKRGFCSFLILGGYGSRPDHNFAMYQTMLWIKEQSHKNSCVARGKGFEIYLLKNESFQFVFSKERYISVFAFGGLANGVSISGAEYELNNASLTPQFPLGVSNSCSDKCNISVIDGNLLVMIVDKNL